MVNPTGRRIRVVHKEGEEGVLHIDADTGQVLTQADERPAWGIGLAVALLANRTHYYVSRLGIHGDAKDDAGKALRAKLLDPEAYSFDDIDWLGVDDAGEASEIGASPDFRQQIIAEVLQLDLAAGTFGKVVAESAVIEAGVNRTAAEYAQDQQELSKERFGGEQGAAEQQKAKSGR